MKRGRSQYLHAVVSTLSPLTSTSSPCCLHWSNTFLTAVAMALHQSPGNCSALQYIYINIQPSCVALESWDDDDDDDGHISRREEMKR